MLVLGTERQFLSTLVAKVICLLYLCQQRKLLALLFAQDLHRGLVEGYQI